MESFETGESGKRHREPTEPKEDRRFRLEPWRGGVYALDVVPVAVVGEDDWCKEITAHPKGSV